jgi:hypothetical protein
MATVTTPACRRTDPSRVIVVFSRRTRAEMEGPEAVGCSVGVEGLVGSTRVGASLLKVIVVVFFLRLDTEIII